MSERKDDIQLVRQAQRGHPEARGDLLRIVEPRLTQYVGRLTLDRELTTDIVQESITEMLKIFDTLKDPERFWCWLYAITLNKVRMHYRQRWRRAEKSLSDVQEDWLQARNQDVLAELVTKELKEIVVRAVCQLEPRQRAVLTMRCYDQMSYQQISEVMRCSQLGARALFHRAKKTLTRLLKSHGIDKSALPVALLIFGKFSATSEAAAAAVSISASTVHVGPWGALAGVVAQRVVLAVLAVAVLVGAGGVAVTVCSDAVRRYPHQDMALRAHYEQLSQDSSCWYYYPPGGADTVMIRTIDQTDAYSQWLQKEQANYYRQGDKIYIRNHRQFAADLAVWRLPTDSPALRDFLRTQDGHDFDLEYVAPGSRGLLVAVEGLPNGPSVEGVSPSRVADLRSAIRGQDARDTGQRRQATLSYDVSMEDYFRHDWSAEAAIVDERDGPHRAGWTYFTVSGHFDGRSVSGSGRLPLVAAAQGDHSPWLTLQIGEDLTLLDSGGAAEVRRRSGAVLARYPGGSFFRGLGRPWSGLHTIDTIRRDAALTGIAFTTRPLPDGAHVEIVLRGSGTRLTYRVHLYQDWIETIVFSKEDSTIGEWTFRYPKPDEAEGPPTRKEALGTPVPHRLPISSPPYSRGRASGPEGLWLMRLAEGSLAQ